jgi:hypothetical protein
MNVCDYDIGVDSGQQSSVNCQNGGGSGELIMRVVMIAEISDDCKLCNVTHSFTCLNIS